MVGAIKSLAVSATCVLLPHVGRRKLALDGKYILNWKNLLPQHNAMKARIFRGRLNLLTGTKLPKYKLEGYGDSERNWHRQLYRLISELVRSTQTVLQTNAYFTKQTPIIYIVRLAVFPTDGSVAAWSRVLRLT